MKDIRARFSRARKLSLGLGSAILVAALLPGCVDSGVLPSQVVGTCTPDLPDHQEGLASLDAARRAGDPDAIDRATQALGREGVTFHTSDEIEQQFPDALETLDRAQTGVRGALSRWFGMHGDRDIAWVVFQSEIVCDGDSFEITSLTARPSSETSSLWDEGVAIIRNDGKVIEGNSGIHTDEDSSETIIWSVATDVQFLYVSDGSSERLSFISSAATVSIGALSSDLEVDEDGNPEPVYTTDETHTRTSPSCYIPDPAIPVQSFSSNAEVEQLCLIGQVEVRSRNDIIVATVKTISPSIR